jgi:hypothetical protein
VKGEIGRSIAGTNKPETASFVQFDFIELPCGSPVALFEDPILCHRNLLMQLSNIGPCGS